MSESNKHDEYLLGVNQLELERLQFQHGVWGPVTKKFLERLNVLKGWRCLDVGAGPGLVSLELREMIGETGEVTALDPSAFYLDWLRKQAADRGWNNILCLQGTAEQAPLPAGAYDLVFVRWVVAFVPDPEKFFTRLFATLRPGGIIAIQDYYYEGLSLYPHGGPCDRLADVVRAYYRSGGGDAYVTGKIPELFTRHGLQLVDFTPTCLAGGPDSAIMEWAHRFFTLHIPLMAEKGVISRDESDQLLTDWQVHKQNQNTLFFSPLVVDVAGRKQAR
jgi:SAM-dependent methyltransferase